MAAELRLDEGVGDGAETEERLEPAPEGDSELPFLVAENEAPVDDTGQATVAAEAFAPKACLSHGARPLLTCTVFGKGEISEN